MYSQSHSPSLNLAGAFGLQSRRLLTRFALDDLGHKVTHIPAQGRWDHVRPLPFSHALQ